jgi:hypothetical protein
MFAVAICVVRTKKPKPKGVKPSIRAIRNTEEIVRGAA